MEYHNSDCTYFYIMKSRRILFSIWRIVWTQVDVYQYSSPQAPYHPGQRNMVPFGQFHVFLLRAWITWLGNSFMEPEVFCHRFSFFPFFFFSTADPKQVNHTNKITRSWWLPPSFSVNPHKSPKNSCCKNQTIKGQLSIAKVFIHSFFLSKTVRKKRRRGLTLL